MHIFRAIITRRSAKKNGVPMDFIVKYFVTFFGVGLAKKAPGTWGTLATVPLVLILSAAGPVIYMSVTVLLIALAILASEMYEKKKGGHDHKEIVIDEVVGFLITMTWLPMTWQSLALGFALFRLLDIWKPLPIGYLDKKVQGGLGVVIDDVAAGIIASLILQYLYSHTNWLGAQMVVFGG